MADITKPDMSNAWADDQTGVVPPDPAKIPVGWIAEKPPFQNENWIQNRSDRWMQSIEQRGSAEWDLNAEYKVNATCYFNGNLHSSLQNLNVGNNPDSSTGWWRIADNPKNMLSNIDAGRTSLPDPVDLNAISASGLYLATIATLNTPVLGELFSVIHIEDSSGNSSQVAVGVTNRDVMYYRSRNATWGVWRKVTSETTLFNETARYLLLSGGAITGALSINGVNVVMTYDISVFLVGNVLSTEEIVNYVSTRQLQIDTAHVNYVPSMAVCITPPDSAASMDITANGVSVGTISFVAAATVGSVVWSSNFILNVGEILGVAAPLTTPVGMKGLSINVSMLTV